METIKENENLKPQLLQITLPSSSVDKKRIVPTNETLIKSEIIENASDFQAFPANTSILTNACNINLPVSSTSARIAEMIRAESFLETFSRNKRKNKTNGILQQENPQCEENKQSEILKAAKSLFSKRTRTLYHWMYPNASKQQLKLAIMNSWETLSLEEKEFYISQVLGRFGFPQRSLMVNPQLGCIGNFAELPNFDVTTFEETRNAVSSILNENNKTSFESEDDGTCLPKKRKLYCRRRKGRRNKTLKLAQEVVGIPEEFQDDPELSRELQQFKWAMGITNIGKS